MRHRKNKRESPLIKMKFSAFEDKDVNFYNIIEEKKPLLVMQSCCAMAKPAKNVNNKRREGFE